MDQSGGYTRVHSSSLCSVICASCLVRNEHGVACHAGPGRRHRLDQVPAVQRILKAAGVAIDWDEHLAGWASMERGGRPSPRRCCDRCARPAWSSRPSCCRRPGRPSGPRPENVNYNVQFRRELGLFASVRPLKNLPGLPARFQGVDMLVIRELTEDLYAAIEHEIVPGVVQSIKVVTEAASRRFFRFAFEWTRTAGRKTVTCVHKANILKLADGLFLEAFRTAARDFPEIADRARSSSITAACRWCPGRSSSTCWSWAISTATSSAIWAPAWSAASAPRPASTSATASASTNAFHGGSREAIGENRANPLPLLLPAIDLLDARDRSPWPNVSPPRLSAC